MELLSFGAVDGCAAKTPNLARVRESASRIWGELSKGHENLLRAHPPQKWADSLRNRPETHSYASIPREILESSRQIADEYGRGALGVYNRLVLLSLLPASAGRIAPDFPSPVWERWLQELATIAEETLSNADAYYDLSKDGFIKDLNICALKLIPIGPCVVEISRLPRSFLLKKGGRQLIKGTIFVLKRIGGLAPLYQIHTFTRGLPHFNESGWDRAFHRMASLLDRDRRVKGVFRASWFIDPKVTEISPRLSYLRERIVGNGGEIFCLGHTQEDVRDATLKSPTRQRLYSEGKYTPVKYLAVWPRNDMIRWAESNNFLEGDTLDA